MTLNKFVPSKISSGFLLVFSSFMAVSSFFSGLFILYCLVSSYCVLFIILSLAAGIFFIAGVTGVAVTFWNISKIDIANKKYLKNKDDKKKQSKVKKKIKNLIWIVLVKIKLKSSKK